jgi:hypothetical protein
MRTTPMANTAQDALVDWLGAGIAALRRVGAGALTDAGAEVVDRPLLEAGTELASSALSRTVLMACAVFTDALATDTDEGAPLESGLA